MKTHMGGRATTPLIRNLGSRLWWVVTSGPTVLAQASSLLTKMPNTHCIGSCVGPKSWSGRFEEEKNLLPVRGFKTCSDVTAQWHNGIHYTCSTKYFLPSGDEPSSSREYSGPSSYDRLDIRTTWVTTKILVLT